MTQQIPLFRESTTIQERFEQFDAAHPEVYRMFRELAIRLLNAGRLHYSSDALLHVIRFNFDVNRERDEVFKCNNDFSSRYARKLVCEDPRFRDFFEFRKLKTA